MALGGNYGVAVIFAAALTGTDMLGVSVILAIGSNNLVVKGILKVVIMSERRKRYGSVGQANGAVVISCSRVFAVRRRGSNESGVAIGLGRFVVSFLIIT